jgi:DNA-binding NarL/FixJ family response regulator
MNVLGVVHKVDEIIQLTKELQPDVLILDPSTPRLEKTQTLAKVCDHSPKTRVICLGDEPSDAMIAHVIQNNVHGYLLKEQTTEEIMTSLLTILNGEKVYAPRLANRMASAYMEPKASPQEQARRKLKAEGLSERQIEILEMVASGRIYKEIAAELTLSESAIKYHTERILTTLKLKNRGELVKYAYQIGLVANRRSEN